MCTSFLKSFIFPLWLDGCPNGCTGLLFSCYRILILRVGNGKGEGFRVTVPSLQFPVYSFRFTVPRLQLAVYSLQFTIYSSPFAVCRLQFTVSGLQFTVYCLQFAVYSFSCL